MLFLSAKFISCVENCSWLYAGSGPPCVCQIATQVEQSGHGTLARLQPLTVPRTGPVVKYFPVDRSLQTLPQYSTLRTIDSGFIARIATRAAMVWFEYFAEPGAQSHSPSGSLSSNGLPRT